MHIFKQKCIISIGIACFSVLLYGHTLQHGYNMDDNLRGTAQTKHVKDVQEKHWKRYLSFFTSRSFGNKNGASYGYRPLTLLLFALEEDIFGKNPGVSHAINVILYACLCALLYILLTQLLNTTPHGHKIAVLTCLLFAAHPLHTEVVASIKNREELLAFLGFLGSFSMILRYNSAKKAYKWLFMALLMAFLGLISKKSALVPLTFVPLGALLMTPAQNGRKFFILCALFGLLIFFFIPLETKTSVMIVLLYGGGWWMCFLLKKERFDSKIRKKWALIGLSLLFIFAVLNPKYKIIWALVATLTYILGKLQKSERYEILLWSSGIAVGYFYWLDWMWPAMGVYALFRINRSKSPLFHAYLALILALSMGFWLHISEYSTLVCLQVGMILAAGAARYAITCKWALSALLLGLPVLAYLENGGTALWIGLLLVAYLHLVPSWLAKLRHIRGALLLTSILIAFFMSYTQGSYRQVSWDKPTSIDNTDNIDNIDNTQEEHLPWLTKQAGRTLHPIENPLVEAKTFSKRCVGAAYTYGRYLQLHLFPYPLRAYYGYSEWTGGSPKSIWLWIAVSLHVGLLILCWRFRKVHKPLVYAIIFYLCCLFPFSNALVLVAGGMGERLAFAASFGFAWAIAYVAINVAYKARNSLKWSIWISCACLILIYATSTYERAKKWKNKATLYANDLPHTSRSAKLQQLMADLRLQQAKQAIRHPEQQKYYLREARHAMEASLSIAEAPAAHWFTMGLIAQWQKDWSSAANAYEKTLKKEPKHRAGFNLAVVQGIIGQYPSAVANYEAHIRAHPQDKSAYANLACLHFNTKNFEEALKIGRKSCKIFPKDANSWLNMGKIYLAKADTAATIDSFLRANALVPHNLQLQRHLKILQQKYHGN